MESFDKGNDMLGFYVFKRSPCFFCGKGIRRAGHKGGVLRRLWPDPKGGAGEKCSAGPHSGNGADRAVEGLRKAGRESKITQIPSVLVFFF